MKNISLSVCLIVKNEEKMLEECLLSVRDIANEIVVVDTGSTDSTIDIAKRYNCKVIRSKWQNNFAQARNVSLENANGTHILVIDADERLINPHQVIPTIQNSDDNVGGWLIKNISKAHNPGGSTDTFVNDLLRLFINHRNIRYNGMIHEQVIDSVLQNGYKLQNTVIEILHLGYGLTKDKMIEKQYRNLELLNAQIEKFPDDYYNIFQRAKTHLALGNPEAAEADTQKVIETADMGGTIYPQALNYGAIIAAQNDNYDLSIARAEKSLKLVANQAFANFILGDCYTHKGDFGKALNYYLKMEKELLNPNSQAGIVGDYILPFEQVKYKIGKSYVGINEYDKAEAQFIEGNKYNPKDIYNIIGLANINFIRNDWVAAKELLLKAEELNPDNAEIKNYLKQLESSQKTVELRNEKESLKDKIDLKSIQRLSLNAEKPLISLSMIVKNEEKFLPGCLESVRGVVDEVIILDTGSTDNTVEIAEKYGAKVYFMEWKDDFALARNESIKHCTGEWILYLDADERLTPQSKDEILHLARFSIDQIGGYICNIESLHLQNDGKTDMHRGGYPRFFRNYGYPTIRFQGRIHEQITPSIFELNKSIDFSDILIKHLGYDTSLEVMEKKVRRNYKLLIKHVQEEPDNAYAWFQLGQTLGMMQLNKESENAVQMAVNLGTLKSSVACSAYSLLAQYAKARKSYEEALNYCELSLQIAPEQVYTRFLTALIYMEMEEPEKAEPIIIDVIALRKKNRGVPKSGFDIELQEEYLEQGLAHCRKLIAEKRSS